MQGNWARKEIENNGLIIISIATVFVYWFFDTLISGVVFVRLLNSESDHHLRSTFTQYLINLTKSVQRELKKCT